MVLMLRDKGVLGFKLWAVLLAAAILCSVSAAKPQRPGWRRKQVDWRVTGGSRVKAIHYPPDKRPLTLGEHRRHQPKVQLKEITPSTVAALTGPAAEAVFANVIDSPPLGGFTPWVVVSITDERGGMWDINADPCTHVLGDPLTGSPESDYAVGIYDTGASVHVISDDAAFKTGIYGHVPNLVTNQPVVLLGATGTATGYASQPLGVFIGGLDILEPDGSLLDNSEMVGEGNVSIIVGDPIESPNLPTVAGIPMAVYFTAAFYNNRQLSMTIDGNDFNSPYIDFYGLTDPCAPSYSNVIDLQLRPADAGAVQYFPCDLLGTCGIDPEGSPTIPSTIWGAFSSQSLYFLPWVNLADGNDSINNLNALMFDTGAQITVISRTIASGLHWDLDDPEFWVEIQDVTGQITFEPGGFLDSLVMPAEGSWLEYTNVPAVAINVQSPEGGFLQGIIGMNLFVDLNFIVRGGGLAGQIAQGYSPKLEFEPVCRVTGDIAPAWGDCSVDDLDLGELAAHWLQTSSDPNWNGDADLAPIPIGDGNINFLDYCVIGDHWLEVAVP
jgi:hypothetical protein